MERTLSSPRNETATRRTRRSSPVKNRGVRVLVVDDDPSVRSALGRLLGLKFQVEVAGSADEAERMLSSRRFSAIVSDFDMPGHDGIWLLSRVAEQFPSTRRIILSGRSPEYFFSHIDNGVVQLCLEKPASPSTLIDFLG